MSVKTINRTRTEKKEAWARDRVEHYTPTFSNEKRHNFIENNLHLHSFHLITTEQQRRY
jgi:hypothetical protein